MMFKNSKNFMGDNPIEGLDELARETVSNDNEYQDDVSVFIFYHWLIHIVFWLIRLHPLIHPIFERHGVLNIFYEGRKKRIEFEMKNWIF